MIFQVPLVSKRSVVARLVRPDTNVISASIPYKYVLNDLYLKIPRTDIPNG